MGLQINKWTVLDERDPEILMPLKHILCLKPPRKAIASTWSPVELDTLVNMHASQM